MCVAGGIFADPLHHGVGIPQRSGKMPLGCQTVVKIDESETATGHIHTVTAVDFLASVHITAAMYGYDGGKWLGCAVGIVNIQQIPLSVAAVGNVAALLYALRKRNGFIAFIIIDGGTNVEHNRL